MTRAVSLLASGLLVAPFVLIAVGTTSASRIGFALGRELSTLMGAGQGQPAAVQAPIVESITATEVVSPSSESTSEQARTSKKTPSSTGAKRHSSPPPAPAGAVYVGARTVLRLANAGVRPTAVAVGKQGERPAGVELRGVSALGLGPLDGDVLTSVQGVAAGSIVDVVRVVLTARAQRAPHVFGQVWRRGQKYSIIVEMPYSVAVSADSSEAPKPSDAEG